MDSAAAMEQKELSVFINILACIENGVPAEEQPEEYITCTLYYRNNPDGTPRWIWPAGLAKPLFLKFYNVSTRKSAIIAFITRLLFTLKLQRLFASGKKAVCFTAADYHQFIGQIGKGWALFTGTAGANRSALFYGNNCFYKIAAGTNASKLLQHEYHNLAYFNQFEFSTLELPEVFANGQVLQQSDISGNGKRVNNLTNLHWLALQEIAQIKNENIAIDTLTTWHDTVAKLQNLQNTTDGKMPEGFVNRLVQLQATINPATIIPTSFCHGDFTPWNLFVQNTKLGVIDWELAQESMPYFFDAFHFIYQQASLVDHCSHRELMSRIRESFSNSSAQSIQRMRNIDLGLHHRLYLLFTAVYYADLYARQDNWHPQVSMSLECWSHAMNELLLEANQVSRRELMLEDIFHFLRDKKYAALKWLAAEPSTVPADSDIDLCMDYNTRKALHTYLQQHPFTLQVIEKRKSFMSSFTVLLSDDTIICIDAILAFKRRHLIMLDAAELLANAVTGKHGVKLPAVEYDFTYMWLFYTLNHSAVPGRYQKHYSAVDKETSKRLDERFEWTKILGLTHYEEVYYYKPSTRNKVLQELGKRKTNKGIRFIQNTIKYYMDTLKEQFFHKGFIITFSGVDGAGKSTVIENVRHSIEKKYRRKVVVLRHRPSVLPMLSAWKEGRAAAEQKAAERLPRQGRNSSTFSSLLRFGYYYMDYFLGQFVVQAKYVCRGYIVLYDRYYFDFINDGKRSNIVLPHWFTRQGYRLLLKPSYNFFLYADADTILQRKKELDRQTISQLTNQYLELFGDLSNRHRFSKYIPIRNEELPLTLQTIFQHVKHKTV